MSKQNNPTSLVKVNTFGKGMVKDLNDTFVGEGIWLHARNAINNAHLGEGGVIGNEQANQYCTSAPYTVIGLIHRGGTEWVVFSTSGADHEIGIFDESQCTYKKLVNSACLNFSTANLITGAVRGNADCTDNVYFQDGVNPDRVLNLDRVPFLKTGRNLSSDPSCVVPEYSTDLDCEAILLQSNLSIPCLEVSRGKGAGQLLNGSYQVTVAYSINGIRVTDYLALSNAQPIWSHSGQGGSIEINLTGLDADFDEYQLVVVSTTNAQTVAREIGYYSTRQARVVLDLIDQALPVVPLALIPLQNPVYDRSDKMFEINGYLIRSGVSTRPDFNYQPLANQIRTRWVSAEYPASYYRNGGNKTSYLRDEQYAFFVRWIYKSGLRSASYHIPGRAALASDLTNASGADALTGERYRWQVYNTATASPASGTLADGGRLVARGDMGYWESTERYPDDKPEIWGALCGKPIRHHKFPDNTVSHIHGDGNDKIYLLGVQFDNIAHPLDDNGNPIADIVGYEILRGSREGNRTVIAKGMFNNMWEYDIEGQDVRGLYQNFPFNDLRPNKLLRTQIKEGGANPDDENLAPSTYRKDTFSFHSPETTFTQPFLSGGKVVLYTEEIGTTRGKFEFPYKHPKHKLLSDTAFGFAFAVGVGVGVLAALGTSTVTSTASATLFGAGVIVNTGRQGGSATGAFDSVVNAIATPTTIPGIVILVANAAYYGALGIQSSLDVIYTFGPHRQYALQYNAHGHYNKFTTVPNGNRRREIKVDSARYIDSFVQDYVDNSRVNNLFRNKFVAVSVDRDIADPLSQDTSRVRVRDIDAHKDPTNKEAVRNTSAYYGALKVDFENQYGQLQNIVQIPIGCVNTTEPDKTKQFTSEVLFGGDVYINRYTEKNPYFFFNTWLLGEVDGTDINYLNYLNGPIPRYWAKLEKYDLNDFAISFDFDRKPMFEFNSPSDFHHMDRSQASRSGFKFFIKQAYFYLFANGVRDFYCESEVNLALRDYGDQLQERHYDEGTFTDLPGMFRSDLITRGNFYKYDYSLSVSKLFNNFNSWGSILGRDYDPTVSYACYQYYPKRVIYSLQQQEGLKRDNWRAFLANNYKDFSAEVNNIKSLNATGAVILFENDEPVQFVGVDQLQTKGGVKVTIGDGGLFQGNMQGMVNADDTLQYGSCQSYYSAVNTPYGLFYISQKTGKVMQFAGSLVEISRNGMNFWFAEHLPSKLLRQFPNFPLDDNPVAGVGCQAIYDAQYELVYFTKKDYVAKEGVFYDPAIGFYLGSAATKNAPTPTSPIVKLGDERYFEDASWTISYDPAQKMWISFHDWKPDLMMPAISHFYTIKGIDFFHHNVRCDRYAEYYSKDYPFEIEFPVGDDLTVTTTRSVEYVMENYRYYNNCQDRMAPLDHNFDTAVLYNNEQSSGWLKLLPKPKNNPVALLQYPKVLPNGIEILYSKEENKYRFNQFADITRNRGEFIPNNATMWTTAANGYERRLNPVFHDYGKPALQRKKFRHYGNRLLLRRAVSEDIKMLLKVFGTKQQISMR